MSRQSARTFLPGEIVTGIKVEIPLIYDCHTLPGAGADLRSRISTGSFTIGNVFEILIC
jgi:hypothetical protein